MCHRIHPRPYLRWRPRPRASPKPLEIAMCPFCKASWVKSGHGWVLGGRMAQPEFCIVKVNAHNKLAPIRSVGWRPSSSSSSSSRSFCCRPLAFHPRRASSLRESRGGDGCALKSTTRLFYSCHRSEDGRTDGRSLSTKISFPSPSRLLWAPFSFVPALFPPSYAAHGSACHSVSIRTSITWTPPSSSQSTFLAARARRVSPSVRCVFRGDC